MINLIKKLGKINEYSHFENEALHLAIENTQNQFQPGVIYDKTIEKTLSNQEKQKRFFKEEAGANGQKFWNYTPFEISGDSPHSFNEDV